MGEGEEDKVIDVIVSTITAYLDPKRILLFGSRARGRGKHLINLDKVDPEFKTLIKEGGRVIYDQH
jgi:predicted nucleotidyltransferase